jgi:hypothetical protein
MRENLILPRFGEAGPDTIMIVGDKEGNGRIAYATATATIVGNQTKLTVTLNLHRVRPGDYVLLTELNGQDSRTLVRLNPIADRPCRTF